MDEPMPSPPPRPPTRPTTTTTRHRSRFVPAAMAAALLVTASADAGTVLYVDDDAAPGGDGLGWDTAYRHLQDALANATPPVQIRLGAGLYRPDRDDSNPDGTGARDAAFEMQIGIELNGGYAGVGADDPDERDPTVFASVLSGDLAGDDGPGFVNDDENSYHVLRADEVDGSAILNGLVVTAGAADGEGEQSLGGGLWIDDGNPTLRGCVFRGNYAAGRGGGVYNARADTEVDHCTFEGNVATAGGGFMHELGSAVMIVDSVFTGNDAVVGGAIATLETGPGVRDSVFVGNTAGVGGAIYAASASPPVLDCVFMDNVADFMGGALHFNLAVSSVKRCVFDGNAAGLLGGAISSTAGSDVAVTNCSFSRNSAGSGGAIGIDESSSARVGSNDFCASTPDHIAGPWVDTGGNDFADLCGDECPADLDASGAVDFGDVILVLTAWGPCPGCPEDLDDSGTVDFGDVIVILTAWGPCA